MPLAGTAAVLAVSLQHVAPKIVICFFMLFKYVSFSLFAGVVATWPCCHVDTSSVFPVCFLFVPGVLSKVMILFTILSSTVAGKAGRAA